MKLSDSDKDILKIIFKGNGNGCFGEGVFYKKFRADNYEKIDEIENLKRERYIEEREEKYCLSISSILELRGDISELEKVFLLCESVFSALRSFYKDNPGASITFNNLAKVSSVSREDLDLAMIYVTQAEVLSAWTSSSDKNVDSSLTPSERILKFKTFLEAVEALVSFRGEINNYSYYFDPFSNIVEKKTNDHDFINIERIEKLKNIKSENYDLKKLIRLCEEMNSSNSMGNYIALGALIRILIDHIPPILGFNTFKEVASCYPGKSIKSIFDHLENGSRNISNILIHHPIKKNVDLPTFTQVNYSSHIDALLGEIIIKIES